VSGNRLFGVVDRIAAMAAPPPHLSPVVCLGFHAIDGIASDLSLHPDQFAALVRRLRDDGFRGVSVREWESGRHGDGRGIIFTFDDGFRSVWSEALPVLADAGFHATVFAITSGIGKRTDWHTAAGALPPMDLMTAAQLRDLVDAGWEIGSHGVRHLFMPTLGHADLGHEARDSRRALEDIAGQPVLSFAYPYGAWSPHAVSAIREAGYTTAWTTTPGRPSRSAALLQPRFVVPPRATEVTLRAMLGPGLTTIHAGLATLDRLRGRRPRYSPYDAGTDCSRFVGDSSPLRATTPPT
jgi:hypothetical protein